jgi:hypothetical protein
MEHMWNEKGYFYYRVLPFCTVRTSYMRWSQAWMLLALAALVECEQPGAVKNRVTETSKPSAINV